MPPALLGAALAFGGAYAAGATLGAALLAGIASAGLSFISQKLFAPDIPKFSSRSIDREHIIRSAVAPRRVIYGEQLVSGVLVFAASRGTAKKNPNEYLHLVIVLAGHEVEEIGQVYFNDRRAERVSSKYRTIYKHLGAPDQEASPELHARFPNLWTRQHRLRGCAYLHVRLKWDKGDRDAEYTRLAWPNGIPQIKAVVKGRKVYDPRTDTTAYSDNWALCMADYLRYGLGSKADEIDYDTVTAAANISDEVVSTNPDGSGNRRYTCNGIYETDTAPLQVLEALRTAGAGAVFWTGGEWHVHAGAPVAATRTLNEDDLRGAISFQPHPPRRNLFNSVRGTFIDPAQSYQATDFPIVSNPQYVAADGGEKMYFDLDLPFTNRSETAQRLAKVELEYQRQAVTCKFPGTLSLLGIRAWEIIELSIEHLGWDRKKFQVIAWRITEDAGLDLDLKEYADAVYRFLPSEIRARDPAPNTILPIPGDVPTIDDLEVVEDVTRALDGTIVVALDLTWSATSSFVVGYDVEFRLSSAGGWTSAGRVLAPNHRIAPVTDGVSYDVRVRAVTILNEPSPWAAVYGHYVVGKTAPPADVTGFRVSQQADGTRQFSWNGVADVDLAGYRLRAKSGTSHHAWGDLDDLHQGLIVASPWETNQLAAGDYTIAIVAVDTSGNESTHPTFITSTLGSPRLGGEVIFQHTDVLKNLRPHWGGLGGGYGWSKEDGMLVVLGGGFWWARFTMWDEMLRWSSNGLRFNSGTNPHWVPTGIPAGESAPGFVAIYEFDFPKTIIAQMSVSFDVEGKAFHGVSIGRSGGIIRRGDPIEPGRQYVIDDTLYLRVFCNHEIEVDGVKTQFPPVLRGMDFRLIGKIDEEFINDADTSGWGGSSAAGRLLPLSKSFALITQIQLALQSTGGGWSWEVVSKDADAPKIKIYDANRRPADAVVDAYVRGIPEKA